MSINNLTAVYVRVSTKHQNISNQRAELLNYCKSNGWNYRTYIDKASGKNNNRLAFNDMVRRLRDGEYNRLLFYKLDRITRDYYFGVRVEQLFRELINAGVEVISLKDNIDLSTAANRFMFRIMLASASYELENMHERLSTAYKNRKLHAEDRGK